jgi:hypothetical protein
LAHLKRTYHPEEILGDGSSARDIDMLIISYMDVKEETLEGVERLGRLGLKDS